MNLDTQKIIDEIIVSAYNHMNDFGNEIVAQKLFELSLPILKESGSGIISAN